jgi:hypothetical protein
VPPPQTHLKWMWMQFLTQKHKKHCDPKSNPFIDDEAEEVHQEMDLDEPEATGSQSAGLALGKRSAHEDNDGTSDAEMGFH